VLQCVAVRFSVLQYVSACCSILKCVETCHLYSVESMWASELQCFAVRFSVLQRDVVCCRVLQCVAVCCSELHDSCKWD